MNKTLIPWVKNPDGTQGFTSNPFTGCLNGCPYCYARRESYGRCKQADLLGYALESGHGDNPFYPRYHPERLLDIVARKKPAGVFLNDRSDGFADYWPKNYQDDIRETIELCPQHRFYLLTKQPQNLIKFSPFPEHCYVGVTVTKPEFLIPALDAFDSIQCSVRYLSIEPMLAVFDVPDLSLLLAGSVDWLIIGSCTGTRKDMEELIKRYPDLTLMPWGKKWTAQPKVGWIEEIVRTCDKAGVKVFLKNNLYDLFMNVPHSDLFWEDMSNLRQEMPR